MTGIKKDLLFRVFNFVEYGSLRVTTPEKETYEFKGAKPGTKADITIKTWDVIDAVAFHHDTGLFETFAENLWTTTSLGDLCSFMFENAKALEKIEGAIGIVDGLMFWAQSKTVEFTPKKALSEYTLDLKYKPTCLCKNDRVLVLGKNNAHLQKHQNLTFFKHGETYEPFDVIIAADPFFYTRNPDVFLKTMHQLLKSGGKLYWRTFIFDEEILTQGKFLSKLVFPGYWTPRSAELTHKVNQLFDLTEQYDVDYPEIEHPDRLMQIYCATVKALTSHDKLKYQELVLVRNK